MIEVENNPYLPQASIPVQCSKKDLVYVHVYSIASYAHGATIMGTSYNSTNPLPFI
jgi:hypothetical protein